MKDCKKTSYGFTTLLVCLLSLVYQPLVSQTKAVTLRGDTVILLEDGRWQFIENYQAEKVMLSTENIQTNELPFNKPVDANTVVKDLDGAYEIWYNGDTWQSVDPSLINSAAARAFKLSSFDGYAMLIHEKISLPIETLQSAALDYIKKAAPDTKVLLSEYRMVSDEKILHMVVSGTIQQAPIIYHYYFASNDNGSTQFIAFTGSKLYDRAKSEFDSLLNGLIIK